MLKHSLNANSSDALQEAFNSSFDPDCRETPKAFSENALQYDWLQISYYMWKLIHLF